MSLAHAYDRRLAEVNESFTDAIRVAGRLDVIADALDHLDIDEQTLLSTDVETFQDGVVESIQTLEINIDALDSLAAGSTSHRTLLVALSRSLEQVIASVGECERIRQSGNKAAALAFFDSREAEIPEAISQTNQLRGEIILSLSDRIWSVRDGETLVGALVDDVRRWQHVTFSKSAHRPWRTGTTRHTGSRVR